MGTSKYLTLFVKYKKQTLTFLIAYGYNFCFQFYNNLVETGTRFLTLDQSNQAGIMYHSKSNLLGFRLRAYKPYVYTGFTMRYLAVGERCNIKLGFIQLFSICY